MVEREPVDVRERDPDPVRVRALLRPEATVLLAMSLR